MLDSFGLDVSKNGVEVPNLGVTRVPRDLLLVYNDVVTLDLVAAKSTVPDGCLLDHLEKSAQVKALKMGTIRAACRVLHAFHRILNYVICPH